MDEKEQLINMLIEEKGGTRKDYENLMNSIAYHESAGTMDSTISQYGGGPGRGKYQFEVGKNRGGITAARRLKQYYESKDKKIPTWLSKATKNDTLDATVLTPDQQDELFLGNMRMHPKADLGKVVNNKQSIPEFWAKYHWAGKDEDLKDRMKSFNHSFEKYQQLDPSNIQTKISEDNLRVKKFQNENKNIKLTAPKSERPQNIRQIDNTRVQQPQIQKTEQQQVTPNLVSNNTNDLFAYLKQKQQIKDQQQQVNQPQTEARTNNKGTPFINSDLTEFNSGDSHEMNPLGGIPLGHDKSVEQNETAFNLPKGKFIFSDRINLGGKLQQVSNSYNNEFMSAYGGYVKKRYNGKK